jgi:PAS domain S-box-containing protein
VGLAREGSHESGERRPWSVIAFIASLAVAAVSLTFLAGGSLGVRQTDWPVLLAFLALLIFAERLFVRFRYGGEINSLHLVEAVVAPLLVAFDPPVVVTLVVGAQIVGAVMRRNTPIKSAFNIAQWALVAAVGAAVFRALTSVDDPTSVSVALSLLLALAIMSLVNQAAFTTVLALSRRQHLREVLSGVLITILPGWLIGWTINGLVGLLFVLAYAADRAAVLLFPVPLVVLHLAYRGYAAARSDSVRLSGSHRASRILAGPFDPHEALEPFLLEVAATFEAHAASIVLLEDGELILHAIDRETRAYQVGPLDPRERLESALMGVPGPARTRPDTDAYLGALLTAAGWRDCLSAPLVDEGRIIGRLFVYDQAAFEGLEAGEYAVIETIARDTTSAIVKGRLLSEMLEDRRNHAELIAYMSDGLVALGEDGTVISWNPAMERITGLMAPEVLGRNDALGPLAARDETGAPVQFHRWVESATLPSEVRITTANGMRRLSCSYSRTRHEPDGTGALIVIARDVTPSDEMAALRKLFSRLAEADAARRMTVEQLQQAVMPSRPWVSQAEFGVAYLASDPSAPTGGDLYDWVVLPSGEVHIAVIDVLGHGVGATKDALSVVHALRLLAAGGTPLVDIVPRADALLGAHNPDLVATAIVVHYDPTTGIARIAGGGHPPAIHVTASGETALHAGGGGVIGWPGPRSRDIVEIHLGLEDTLVLYTDGLVEARRDIDAGIADLIAHARDLRSASAADIATGLMEQSMRGAERRDDSVVLVLKRTPVIRASWSLLRGRDRVHEVRGPLAAWLADRDLEPQTISDLILVSSELLNNAMNAARERVDISIAMDGGRITIEVTDDGMQRPTIPRVSSDPPGAEAESGRGLFIARQLTDELKISHDAEGTRVWVRRDVLDRERNGHASDVEAVPEPHDA